jgi:hypothetical protein
VQLNTWPLCYMEACAAEALFVPAPWWGAPQTSRPRRRDALRLMRAPRHSPLNVRVVMQNDIQQ